jgi:uncharacterized protein
MTPASYVELAQALASLRLGISVSELHGSLTGFLCAGGAPAESTWLHDLALDEVDDALVGSATRPLFDRLFVDCTQDMDDPDLGFDLMLPSDEQPMTDRALALVEWCRGFLGGLGLSGAKLDSGLSDETNEVLHDLSRIAATNFDAGDTAEDDEEAYVEVVEYVRVGVMLLHNELTKVPREATLH